MTRHCDSCRYHLEEVRPRDVLSSNWTTQPDPEIRFFCAALPEYVEIRPGRPPCRLHRERVS